MRKRKKIIRNATRIHIKTPLFHYWEKYGGEEGEWYLGINKAEVDHRALLNGLIDLTYWKFEQIKCIKATTIQKYPVETIKRSNMEVYIVPCRIIRNQINN